ncbi:MAG: hypothetical protein QM763_14045 [Agriterribacter sp.]
MYALSFKYAIVVGEAGAHCLTLNTNNGVCGTQGAVVGVCGLVCDLAHQQQLGEELFKYLLLLMKPKYVAFA